MYTTCLDKEDFYFFDASGRYGVALNYYDALCYTLRHLGFTEGKIGCELSGGFHLHMDIAMFNDLKRDFPDLEFVDTTELFWDILAVKSEAQLKNIVESAGLLEHVDFDTQVVVTDADGHTQRPDMIIHMPGGKTIPIDAKAPYADYQRACEIPDTASPEELARKNELLHSHAKAVRDHVKTLGDKAYWNAFSDAPDFVIAFIPNESLLQAALETDPTLMDDAFAQKVALTSPITLWAVLKSVAYAWQQQSLTDDAKMLFDLSRELYERFAVLGERATKLGSAITKTVGAYNSFAASLESRVLVTARKLQRVDQSKVIGTVDMIAPEKGDIRELSAPETNAE